MFKNILIVCVGNVCRSPAAEALFAHRLKGQNLAFSSAGVGALVGNPMDKTALEILQEHGVDHSAHRARQVDSHLPIRKVLPSTSGAIWRMCEIWPCSIARIRSAWCSM